MRTAGWLLLCFLCSYASADETTKVSLNVVVAEFPPYIKDDGEQGVFIEVLNEVALEAGVVFNYLMAPWARAQRMVQGNSDYLIAPLTRTETRESQYQWVIPVLSDPYYLYQLAGIDPETISDEGLILVQRESPGLEYLQQQGYASLFEINSERLGARMLMNRRGTYWLAREMVAYYLIEVEAPGQAPPLASVLSFETEAMYLGAGQGVDQSIIRQLRIAFEAIQQDGRYNAIIMRYRPQ